MLFENIYDLTFTGFTWLNSTFSELETPDSMLAEGGFGRVYEVDTINGVAPSRQLVVKQFVGAKDPEKKGYKTIVSLQERLRAYLKKQHPNPDDFIHAYPGLLALPLCSFRATVNGKDVWAYCSLNLNGAGFVDLDMLGEDSSEALLIREEYLAKRFEARLLTAYRFVSALAFLKDELQFQHADIKAESVWINLTTNVAALIDYDGGAAYSLLNSVLKPTVIRTQYQSWLAPELVDISSSDDTDTTLRVSWESDYWAAAVGTYYLLDLHQPYQFIIEPTPNAYQDYFSRFTWPEADYPEQADWIEYQTGFVDELPTSLAMLFRQTFGKGYEKKSNRSGFYAFQLALKEALSKSYKPVITAYFAQEVILANEPVLLHWEVNDATRLKLDGQNVALSGQQESTFSQTRTVWFEAHNEFAFEKFSVTIEVIPLPTIVSFTADTLMVAGGQRVTIRWQTQHTKRTELIFEDRRIDVSAATEYSLDLRRSMTFLLVAHTPRNLTSVEDTIDIRVIPPIYIDHFSINPLRIIQTKPVTITWQVRNATHIRLEPNGQEIAASGQLDDYPNENPKTYRLIARNELFEERRDIVVNVFLVQVPSIKLPTPPRLPTFGGSSAMPRSGQIRLSTQQIQQRVEAKLDSLIDLATQPKPKRPGRWYKQFLDRLRT